MLKRLSPAQWFCLAAAILLTGLAVLAYFVDTLPVESSSSLIGMHRAGIGMLTEDSPAAQTFLVTESGLSSVDVMVSTYNKKLHEGTITLWLTDDQGREVARLEQPVEGLRNNAFITLPLPAPAGDSRNKQYTLHAASNCVEQKGVTLRMGPLNFTDHWHELTMADGSRECENALNLRLSFTGSARGSMAMYTLALMAVCFAACIPLAKGKETHHG